MRVVAPVRSLRSTALPVCLAALALTLPPAARVAGAQTVSAAYAPFSGPGTGSGSVRFGVTNTTGAQLLFNTLTLSAVSPFSFATVSGSANTGTFIGVDAFGPAEPLTGPTSITSGGMMLSINFPGSTGGLQFTLDAGGSGYVEVALSGTPGALTPGAFSFTATAEGVTRPIGGTVSVAAASTVPEPSTYALLATGLGTLGLVARRRRAA